MAKLTLADITAITGNEASVIAAINANSALIETAIENTLSRDGTAPNTMTADIDLNSNKVINVDTPTNNTDAATKKYVDDILVGSGAVSAPADPGDDGKVIVASGGLYPWTSFTVSLISDAVAFMKTFLTSATIADARTNLGVAIGSDVQAFDATILVDADIGSSVQAHSAVLDATTASFLTADETKLDAITGTNTGDEVSATVTVEGIIERSTSAENVTGTSDVVYPTVAGTKEMIDTHGGAGGTFENELLHIREEQTSGTHGGASSATTYNIRVLNTVKTNEIAGASLSSNQITLPAGTYYIDAWSSANKTATTKQFLYNVTDAAYELVGSQKDISAASAVTADVRVKGRFTIPAEEVFELRTYTFSALAASGLGKATALGHVEVYSEVLIWKVA